MKRLWLGVGILAVLVSLGVASTVGVGRVCEPLSQNLASAADQVQAGKWEQAVTLSQQSRARWERWHHIIAALTDHEPMDEVDSLFAALEIYARENDRIRFADCCARLSALIEAIGEAQAVYWWSIL